MTQKQYDELVKLMDSIEFIDKELINDNKFITKINEILNINPIFNPYQLYPNGGDKRQCPEPYELLEIRYDGTDDKYDPYKINIPKEYKFTGVDKMKFVTKDESVATHIYSQSPVISKETQDALVEMSIGIYDEPSQARYTNIHNL